jgi:hypothetical protein
LWQFFFLPDTYYRTDTQDMFRSMVQAAVLEVLDNLLTVHKLPLLTESERKPILREFWKK